MKRVIKKFGQGLSRFRRRHPLFALAVVAVVCVVAADRAWWLGVLVALVMGVFGGLPRDWKRVALWAAVGLVAVGIFSVRKELRARAERALVGTAGHFEARLLEDGRGGGGVWEAPVKLVGGKWRGTKIWWEGTGQVPVAGAVVEGSGNFVALRGPRNPEEFDEAAWMRRRGMIAAFQGQVTGLETGAWASLGEKIRRGFREGVTAGLETDSEEAKVIRAVVVGEYPADADELVAAFRNSGTLHIFSVSGLHVAMVGSICWFILRWLGVPRRWAVVALLPLVFGYSWITGNSPPAVRSAWMMAVFLMAFVFRREPDLLNSLGAVLLAAMLWDGNLLFQPGVQLSYGVVAAIAAGTAWMMRWFSWLGKKDEYLPDDQITGWRAKWLGARRKFAVFLGVSAAAWVGSTPLTIIHFGLVTPVALFATGVLGPLVYVMLAVALFSALVHPVAPGVSGWVNRGNARVADLCVASAQWMSSLPGSHFSTRSPGKPKLLVYDLDYGAGAACFSGGRSGAVLFDCGDRQAFRYQIAKSLRGLGISPDSVVISHPDGGHLGGAEEVWGAFPIRQVLLPVDKSRSPVYRRWREEAPEAGLKVLLAEDFNRLPLPDGAMLEVLYVPPAVAQNMQADERVAIYRLHWRGWKILLASDAGIGIGTKLAESGKDITADVIITGKNRDGSSFGDEMLEAVGPRAIVASHSDFPLEERLDPRLTAYWRSLGIAVIDQGKAGGVTIRVDDEGDLTLKGYVDGSAVRLKRGGK